MTDLQDLLRRLRESSVNESSHELQCRCMDAADALEALQKEVEELRRGEYICKRCGLRKDSEPPEGLPEF